MHWYFRVFLLLFLGGGRATLAWATTPVPLPETQVHEFTSTYTGRLYQLRVGLPRNYDPTRRRYTVVYQTDGQWDFDRVFPLTRSLEADRRLEPMIVVGITYGGINPDYGALRQRDYTPLDFLGGGQTGDAPKFLQTLRNEIITLIESRYACRTDERILMGSSYGGLFVSYALLTAPDLFTGYVASSPSIWVGNYYMVNQARMAGVALAGRTLRVRIITGANEAYAQTNGAQQFRDALVGLNLPGLDLKMTLAPNERHGAVAQVAYTDGLPEVVRPKLVLFPKGPGEPVDWSPVQPAVTYEADLAQLFPVAGLSGVRRIEQLEPVAGSRVTAVGGVIYVLDAQWDLRSVEGSYGGMLYDLDVPNRMRVGLDWQGDWDEVDDARSREFTPTDPAGTGLAGGAAGFRTFVREQAIPTAEANLTSSPGYRMVLASEKAALWALYDLLGEDPTFDRYLLAAPAVEWDNEWLLQFEAARAARGGRLDARLLVYYGDQDVVSGRVAAIERFFSQLQSRGYPGLSVQLVKLPGRGPVEAKQYGYHKGFRILAP